MNARVVSGLGLIGMVLVSALWVRGADIGTAFTYQGQLKQSGNPLNGSADMRFAVWDVESGGTEPVAVPVVFDGRPGNDSPVNVVNGLFTVRLDFGAFDFAHEYARWLEVAVRIPHDPTDGAPYTTLIPRQKLTPTPYAIRAKTAASAETVLSHGHSLDAADGDPVDALFVDNDGNVGIGTTAPWGKLNVGGDVRVGLVTEDDGSTEGFGDRLSFSGGDDWSEWDSDNSDPLWIARYNVSSNQTELRVNIGDDAEDVGEDITDRFVVGSIDAESENWNPRLTVQSTGNVGIGTTSPRAKLTIADVGSDQTHGNSAIYLADCNKYFDYDCGMVLRGSGSNWATRFTSTDDMNPDGEIVGIYKAESTAGDVGDIVAIFKNDGNVGIGTTRPEGKLDIVGSIERVGIGGDFPDFWWDTFDNNGFWFTNRNNDQEGHTLFQWDNGISRRNILDLRNNGDVLIPDGNVGIGTNGPQAKLDVAGDIAVNGQTIVDSEGRWVGDPSGLEGPTGPEGPQGPPGPAVTTVAVCTQESPSCEPGLCNAMCGASDHVVVAICVDGPGEECYVTSDTGSCRAAGGYINTRGVCCVCRP